MKTKLLGALSIVVVYLISACNIEGNHASESEGNTTDTLTYQYQLLKKSSHTAKGNDSTYISIRYPQFKEQDLNQFIQKIVLEIDSERAYKSLEALTDSFIHTYNKVISEDTNYRQAWFSEISINASQPFPGLVSLENQYSNYTGGAHGMYGTIFYNYDLEKHRKLTLNDLFGDTNLVKLTQRAETFFRKKENLSSQASLKDTYFFENGQFALTENFQIRETDLLFFYNPYDIKPYAAGTTRLEIPYTAIKDLLNHNSIIYKEINK